MVMESQLAEEVVIVAVSKHPCSILALKWALANINSRSTLKLLHVVREIGSISASSLGLTNGDMNDSTSTSNISIYSSNICEEKKATLHAHRELCYVNEMQAEIVFVEGYHVAKSLVEHAFSLRAKKVIIGQSNKTLSRMWKRARTSDIVTEKAAKFCTVFVISDGKPVSIKGPAKNGHPFSAPKNENSHAASVSKTSSKSLSSQQTGSSYVSLLVKEQSLHQAIKLDTVSKEAAQREPTLVDEHVLRTELSAEMLSREDEMQSHQDVGDEATSLVPLCEEVPSPRQQAQVIYRKYDFKEIRTATNDFAVENMIGKGGYGSVYKGKLDHTKVAIKVLESGSFQGSKEFQQEVDFLGHMHHPHIILLLGACPVRRCLVYEYLANGSLEDRLQCKGNTPPLLWHTRIRIAAEIATALLFLHSLKPNPYVHRDVKPQNILLDSNFVSKLGDVGLTAFAPNSKFNEETNYKIAAVGTPPYMDPAYCMTGTFSPRSDVYGYGLVVLRLLTGKVPFKLQDLVQESLQKNCLKEILDPAAGDWPIQLATELAKIATRCTKFKPSDRPDFAVILPQLEKLAMIADEWSKQSVKDIVPREFICPISQAVMKNPHVAADGFTYELAEIQKWLQDHRRSPVTKLKLEHKGLLPNHTLRMAIIEWQLRHSSM